MISAVIFVLHGLAAVYLFVSRKKKAGIGEGFLAVGLFGILFSVGWTILTMVSRLLLTPEGLAEWFDRDTATLSMLTILEASVYFALRPGNEGREDSGGNSTSA